MRVLLFLVALLPVVAFAQSAGIALGTGSFDSNAPVDVTSDSLSLDQDSGQAVFEGNVLVVQGGLRMSAAKISVTYGDDGVTALTATGGVTLVTPTEAAEAQEATYTVADASAVLSGDVLLTQGNATISGDRLFIDLQSGTGRMEGNVRTVLGATQ